MTFRDFFVLKLRDRVAKSANSPVFHEAPRLTETHQGTMIILFALALVLAILVLLFCSETA